MGKGNNTGAFLVWSQDHPYKIIRAHHFRIKEGSIGALFDGIYTKGIIGDPRSKGRFINFKSHQKHSRMRKSIHMKLK